MGWGLLFNISLQNEKKMGKGAILKGRNKENIYPVTASDLVFDPVSKKNVKAELSEKVEEAPMDGKQYARMGGAWAEVEAGAVSETVLITITPALSELHGVDVRVTTNEGDTVLDTPWTGAQLSCQVRAGLQYTVSVGSKDGFIAPEPLTYTAVKGATKTVSMAYIESRLKVSILSNQGEDSAISGVKATVKYGSTTVQVSNGGTVNLPQDVDVTITFPSVDGYKTPDEITYHHDSGGYEKSGTYQTEIVKVTLSASNGASVNGQIVTIKGVEHTWNGTVIQQKIPFGMYYNVVANEKSGYNAPSTKLIQASQSSRDLSMVYVASAVGVFIQDIYGNLYTEDEWDSSKTPNGIAVLTDECQFVIALEDIDGYHEWGYGLVSGITTVTNSNEAQQDFDGEAQTDIIINELGDNALAANKCKSFVFPNGQRGYLGAAGEWYIAYNNWNTLEALSSIIDLDDLLYSYYWTSTQHDSINVWQMPMEGKGLGIAIKEDTNSLRAFAPYIANPKFITFTIEGAEYKCLEGTTWEEWCGSAFNTNGFAVKNNRVEDSDGRTLSTTRYESGQVGVSDEIVSGATYYRIAVPI